MRTLIYETLHGSRAYGLARPGSDTDLKGLYVARRELYLGFLSEREQVDLSPDHALYEIRKFMRLAAKANPSMIELLFTDPQDHLFVSEAGAMLLSQRSAFLSQLVEQTFARYASSQLKRIRRHRAWILRPPRPGEGGWTKYQEWRAHRNPARARLEELYGYDTKHGMHLIRLLRMALEMTVEGVVRVRRPDREELLGIRDGSLSYEQLVGHAEELLADIEHSPSVLPREPDLQGLQSLCVEIVEVCHAHADA